MCTSCKTGNAPRIFVAGRGSQRSSGEAAKFKELLLLRSRWWEQAASHCCQTLQTYPGEKLRRLLLRHGDAGIGEKLNPRIVRARETRLSVASRPRKMSDLAALSLALTLRSSSAV
jgi:hypothetical protein